MNALLGSTRRMAAHLGAFKGEGGIVFDAEADNGVRLFRHPVLEVPLPP